MNHRLALVVCLVCPGLLHAQLGGLGVFGDSLSDEYLEESYSYAKNWVEQSVLVRGVNVGPTAAGAGQPGNTWGEPRRTGFAANWARSGATSTSLLGIVNNNNATINTQVGNGQITHAVVSIGANDFVPGGTAWNNIYNGTWTPAQIQTHRNLVVNNITAIVTTLQNKGIKMVVSSVPDYGAPPAVRAAFPDPAKRELVTSVLNDVNLAVKQMAQVRQIVFADLFGMSQTVFGTNASPNSTIIIGGNVITLSSFGTAPTNAFVHDGIHPHTLIQGSLGSLYLEALRLGYNTGVSPFTEQETVELAGLSFSGNTLPFTYGQFVYNFAAVPEPATMALLVVMIGIACGGYFWRRRQLRLAQSVRIEC